MAAERLDDLQRMAEFLDAGLLMHGSLLPMVGAAYAVEPPYVTTNKYGVQLPVQPVLVATREPQIALAHATLMGLDSARGRGTFTRYATPTEIVVVHHISARNREAPALFAKGYIAKERAASLTSCFGYLAFLDPEGAVLSKDRPLCYEYPNQEARIHAVAEVTLGDLVEVAGPQGIVKADKEELDLRLPPYLLPNQPHEQDPANITVISFAEWRARQFGDQAEI